MTQECYNNLKENLYLPSLVYKHIQSLSKAAMFGTPGKSGKTFFFSSLNEERNISRFW